MSSKQVKKRGLIFVVSGPSGSGKTSLRDKLLADRDLKTKLVKSISFTTRPRRSGERNARDYFFISEPEFRRLLKAKKILEWTRYLGYYYATPRDYVRNLLKRGKHMMLCLDLKGARRIRRFYPRNTKTIFILPPSLKALRERIEGRCKKIDMQELERRIKLARKEILAAGDYDYSLVNKDMQRAEHKLKQIVIQETRKLIAER